MGNTDQDTIESFGREWAKFDQSALSADEDCGLETITFSD